MTGFPGQMCKWNKATKTCQLGPPKKSCAETMGKKRCKNMKKDCAWKKQNMTCKDKTKTCGYYKKQKICVKKTSNGFPCLWVDYGDGGVCML